MDTLSKPVSMLHPGAELIMDYDVFKIFEALIDDKELDDEQKQFYEQKKQEFDDRFVAQVNIQLRCLPTNEVGNIYKTVDYRHLKQTNYISIFLHHLL
ncbi:MAG: hypothetical protein EZS28_034103 [Streblomastix strix]|uniref:Uncharacterized protein n=1 Tax=Streblomastix strix TaxID=222440 RepID=A0A5J4UJW0_9EUKA|nr:MAG: hypothetical protein EZS28_034103 [Streblomastix strix]